MSIKYSLDSYQLYIQINYFLRAFDILIEIFSNLGYQDCYILFCRYAKLFYFGMSCIFLRLVYF